MPYQKGITGFIRVPESETPEKVFGLGPGGKPVSNEEELQKLTGASTIEEAFKEVQIKTPEEARKLGVRLAGTESLFPGQPQELTAEMLREGQFKLPDEKAFDAGSVLDRTGYIQTLVKRIEDLLAQAEQSQKEKEEAKKARGEGQENLAELEEETPSMAEMLEEQWDKWGLGKTFSQQKQLITEADTIRQNIINLEAERDQKLIEWEGKPLSSSYISGQKSVVERQYNSRIAAESARLSAKASMISALQGQITQATNLSNQMVNAMTWDYQRDRDALKDFIDFNSDLITELGADYKDVIETAYNNLDTLYNEKKEEAQGKADLMLDAATKYGVTLPDLTDMTLEEVQQAHREAIAPYAKREWQAGVARTEQLTKEDEGELSPLDADLEGAANIIIALENAGASTNEAYWGVVDGLAEDLGLPRESVDKMLIKKIQDIKGETPQTIQEVEENIASDFITDVEAMAGKTQAEKAREIARQKAIKAGQTMFLDPITGKIIKI